MTPYPYFLPDKYYFSPLSYAYHDSITNNSDFEIAPKPMNIKEKFVLALTSEPQKSFRKAGITNGDDLLTEDGLKIFLSYLLHKKFADDFKKEVVDELLKEEEKTKE